MVELIKVREGEDQESIQSSTTPDPGYHMGKRRKHNETVVKQKQAHGSCFSIEW